MNSDKQGSELQDFQHGYITFPYDKDNFKEFIVSLLGTPQTIRRKIRGVFEVHLKDLQNFHELINQRVTQQNKGKLIQLTTKIYYSDDSSVLLSSFEELVTYNEVKPVISIAVKMTWTYLLHFEEKNHPEKQSIEITISSPYAFRPKFIDDLFIGDNSTGNFDMVIEHTARSWGSDIESLITNQVNSIVRPQSPIRRFIYNYKEGISVTSGLLFFLLSLISVNVFANRFNTSEEKIVDTFIKGAKVVDKKVDFLLNYIAKNRQSSFLLSTQLYYVILAILSIAVIAIVSRTTNNPPKSFLVLTREANTYRAKEIKRSERKVLWFWISLVIGLISGVVSNYIFQYITNNRH